MNARTFFLFRLQSKIWVGMAHLLVMDMELSGRKRMHIFSPSDRMFHPVDAVIWSSPSDLTDQFSARRAFLTAARKSDADRKDVSNLVE